MMSVAEIASLRPAGGFGAILADPPWAWEARSEAGLGKSPEAHYGTMAFGDILSLPVAALAAPDCLLWLWATWPKLNDALLVLHAWGFDYRTGGAWVKTTNTGKPAMGTGYILRSASEPYLLAVRGSPAVASRSVRGVILAPDDAGAIVAPRREHSRKPPQAHEHLEALRPDVPKLELFARERRAGWAVWGDQADKFGGGG